MNSKLAVRKDGKMRPMNPAEESGYAGYINGLAVELEPDAILEYTAMGVLCWAQKNKRNPTLGYFTPVTNFIVKKVRQIIIEDEPTSKFLWEYQIQWVFSDENSMPSSTIVSIPTEMVNGTEIIREFIKQASVSFLQCESNKAFASAFVQYLTGIQQKLDVSDVVHLSSKSGWQTINNETKYWRASNCNAQYPVPSIIKTVLHEHEENLAVEDDLFLYEMLRIFRDRKIGLTMLCFGIYSLLRTIYNDINIQMPNALAVRGQGVPTKDILSLFLWPFSGEKKTAATLLSEPKKLQEELAFGKDKCTVFNGCIPLSGNERKKFIDNLHLILRENQCGTVAFALRQPLSQEEIEECFWLDITSEDMNTCLYEQCWSEKLTYSAFINDFLRFIEEDVDKNIDLIQKSYKQALETAEIQYSFKATHTRQSFAVFSSVISLLSEYEKCIGAEKQIHFMLDCQDKSVQEMLAKAVMENESIHSQSSVPELFEEVLLQAIQTNQIVFPSSPEEVELEKINIYLTKKKLACLTPEDFEKLLSLSFPVNEKCRYVYQALKEAKILKADDGVFTTKITLPFETDLQNRPRMIVIEVENLADAELKSILQMKAPMYKTASLNAQVLPEIESRLASAEGDLVEYNSEYMRFPLFKSEKGRTVGWCIGHPEMPNRILSIIGKSGYGKSYLCRCVMKSGFDNEISSFVIDYSGSYSPEQRGEAFDIAVGYQIQNVNLLKQGLPVDIFALAHGEDESRAASKVATAFAKAFRLGDQQRAVLFDVFKHLYFLQNTFTPKELEDFLAGIQTTPFVKTVRSKLRPFFGVRLTASDAFLSWDDVLYGGKITILEMAGYDDATKRVLTELVLQNMWAHIERISATEEKLFFLVLDEAQMLDLSSNSTVDKLITQGRKFGVGTILSTQIMGKIAKDRINVAGNAGLQIFFHPEDEELRHIAQKVGGENYKYWESHLRQLKKTECVVYGALEGADGGLVEGAAIKCKVKSIESL